MLSKKTCLSSLPWGTSITFQFNFTMFKKLLFSALVSSSLHAVPLEISEEKMPALPNESSPFRGQIKHSGYIGHTWVGYPHVENPASLDMDPMGRLLLPRPTDFGSVFPTFGGLGDDPGIFKPVRSRTVLPCTTSMQTRETVLGTHKPDRLIRLEDRDGNGRSRPQDSFPMLSRRPSTGFVSILAERNSTYFTCIPALRRLTDPNDDGVATNEKIVNGLGCRFLSLDTTSMESRAAPTDVFTFR